MAAQGKFRTEIVVTSLFASEICKAVRRTKPCQPASVVKHYAKIWDWPKQREWKLCDRVPNLGIISVSAFYFFGFKSTPHENRPRTVRGLRF